MTGIGDDFSIFRVNPTPNVLDDDEKGRRQRGRQDADSQGYKEQKDQARIDTENPLSITASKNSEFLLIDVPSCKGWGYDHETLRGEKR